MSNAKRKQHLLPDFQTRDESLASGQLGLVDQRDHRRWTLIEERVARTGSGGHGHHRPVLPTPANSNGQISQDSAFDDRAIADDHGLVSWKLFEGGGDINRDAD